MTAPRAGRPKSHAKKTRPPGRAGKPKAKEPPILLSSTLPVPGCRPGEWNEGEPLRATVLIHAPDELAGYFRHFFDNIASTILEHGPRRKLDYRGSYVKAKLLAAMLDLRYTAGFLAHVAREAADEMVDRWPRSEKKLGAFADQLALEVEKIAKAIEARLEKGGGKRS